MRYQPPSLILTAVVCVLGGIGLLCGLVVLALDRRWLRRTSPDTPEELRTDGQM